MIIIFLASKATHRFLCLFLLCIILSTFDSIYCDFVNCSGKLLSEDVCLPSTYQKSTIPQKPTLHCESRYEKVLNGGFSTSSNLQS